MPRQTLTNGESGLSFRTKLNENFVEVYANIEMLASSGGGGGGPGLSAYQVAVANGFNGTESQWLASLVGAEGDNVTITEFTDETAFNAATPGPLELAVLYDA